MIYFTKLWIVYCEYIAEDETKTCRELAIQENYKAKTADKPEMKIYSKYYKRYSARVKTGQITEENSGNGNMPP